MVYLYIQGLSIKPLLPLNQAVLAHSEIVRTLLKALDRAVGPVQRFRGLFAFLKQTLNIIICFITTQDIANDRLAPALFRGLEACLHS